MSNTLMAKKGELVRFKGITEIGNEAMHQNADKLLLKGRTYVIEKYQSVEALHYMDCIVISDNPKYITSLQKDLKDYIWPKEWFEDVDEKERTPDDIPAEVKAEMPDEIKTVDEHRKAQGLSPMKEATQQEINEANKEPMLPREPEGMLSQQEIDTLLMFANDYDENTFDKMPARIKKQTNEILKMKSAAKKKEIAEIIKYRNELENNNADLRMENRSLEAALVKLAKLWGKEDSL